MAKKQQKVIIKKKIIKDSKQDKVAECMRKFTEGKLKDSHGKIVTDKDQAIAIALSEAGLSRKGLEKAEILNKVKLYKKQVERMLYKQQIKDESIFDKIINFFSTTKNPQDSQVHELAEKNNIDPHKVEQVIYMILSDIFMGGVSKGQDNGFDPEEIKMGMMVEKEHTSIPAIQRKIVYDHLTENPKYYSEGKEKGVFPELVGK